MSIAFEAGFTSFVRRIQQADEVEYRFGPLGVPVQLYTYGQPRRGWRLSIATQAQTGQMSLGGLRIVPGERVEQDGYNNDAEAVSLAGEMGNKIGWTRRIGVGTPLILSKMDSVLGGKCVVRPTPDARVGQSRDVELLDFILGCFRDFEATSGVALVTGQDLGHGCLSTGDETSLDYMDARFRGVLSIDTSRPTAAGNFRVICGALTGAGRPVRGARVGLIGCGNIGFHLLHWLLDAGAAPRVLEVDRSRRARVAALGVPVTSLSEKEAFLRQPMDVLAVNANGGSLDAATIGALVDNEPLIGVAGCENLALRDPHGVEHLRAARKIFYPTEYCGMFGYLSAVEAYLHKTVGRPQDIEPVVDAARGIEAPTRRVTRLLRARNCELSFGRALETALSPAPRLHRS